MSFIGTPGDPFGNRFGKNPFGDRFQNLGQVNWETQYARKELEELGVDERTLVNPSEVRRIVGWKSILRLTVRLMVSKAADEYVLPILVGILQMIYWDLRLPPEEPGEETSGEGRPPQLVLEEPVVEVVQFPAEALQHQGRQLLGFRFHRPRRKKEESKAVYRQRLQEAFESAVAEAETTLFRLAEVKAILRLQPAERPLGWQVVEVIKLMEVLIAVASIRSRNTELDVEWEDWRLAHLEDTVSLLFGVVLIPLSDAKPIVTHSHVKTICGQLEEIGAAQLSANSKEGPELEEHLDRLVKADLRVMLNFFDFPLDTEEGDESTGG